MRRDDLLAKYVGVEVGHTTYWVHNLLAEQARVSGVRVGLAYKEHFDPRREDITGNVRLIEVDRPDLLEAITKNYFEGLGDPGTEMRIEQHRRRMEEAGATGEQLPVKCRTTAFG